MKYLIPLLFLTLACLSQSFPPERHPDMPKKLAGMIHHTPFLMAPDSTNTYRIVVEDIAPLPDNPTNAFLTIIQDPLPPIVVPVRVIHSLTNVWHVHVYPGEFVTMSKMPDLSATNMLYFHTNRANLMLLEVHHGE